MSIGIIGAGNLGSSIARALAQKNIPAVIASRRGPEALKKLASELGACITPVSIPEAAKADIVVVALHWTDLESALRPLAPWDGRIVIDAANPVEFIDPNSPEAKDPSNPLAAFGIKAVDLKGQVSSKAFTQFVPGARVVKAFNHLPSEVLWLPKPAEGHRTLFYSGDDVDAKAKLADLITKLDFAGVDLGALEVGGRLTQIPGGPLAMLNLLKV